MIANRKKIRIKNDSKLKISVMVIKTELRQNWQMENDKRVPKEALHCMCLSVIVIDSVCCMINKNYYSQVFMKECKYKEKNKKIIYITGNIEFSSCSNDDDDDDDDNDDDNQ